MNRLQEGQNAPLFTLPDQDGNPISLSDYKGKKVLVYFYPKAMTPGCTVQACGLRDNKRKLSGQDAVAIGISPDSVARLKKFEDKESLNFVLLSDEDHAVADKYGGLGAKEVYGQGIYGR